MTVALFIAFGVGLAAICGWTVVLGPGWFWSLKQPVRIALMLSLGLVGALGVWRAAAEAERVEPVWMDAGNSVVSVPIRVRMPRDLDTYVAAVRAAMRMWNEQAGCRLFVEEAPDAEAYDVRILSAVEDPCEGVSTDQGKDVAASTYFCAGGAIDIAPRRLDEIQVAYVIFAHELGHVLGLAHDPTGLMAPKAEELTLVLPSEKDLRAVRARYCLGGKP